MSAAAAAAALVLLCSGAARAQPVAASAAAASSLPDGTIAEVRVERKNVFDPKVPGEDWWGFQAANKLHIMTRESVIRRELLLQPGDRWDALKAIESERNMRAYYPFRRAEVARETAPDGRVVEVVRTQDSWTTNPRLAFGTEGGQNYTAYGLEENNLLGYGKSVSYTHTTALTTSGYKHQDSYGFGDPRVLGTRFGLGAGYSKGESNASEQASLSRPFYSLDAARAAAISWKNSTGERTIIRDAADYSSYSERRRVVDAAYGVRLNADRFFVQRVEAGWYEDRAAFQPVTDGPGTLPGTLPVDRHLSGPTVGYSWIQPRYIKETDIDRMDRVEDFNLGNELRARTGAMARGFGADEDRWIFNASDRQGLSLGPGRFILAGVGASGRVFNNRWENALFTANLNLFWKNELWSRERTLVAHAEAAEGRRLDRENQIILGGGTGLRGYKNSSFVGGRSVLVNLEDRFFFDREWFHLIKLGGAVFVESGSVVPEGGGFSFERFKSDVGAGLRAASTRSTSGGVVRMDLAYALNSGPGGSRWVISVRGGQAFSFFNSASRGVSPAPSPNL